MLRVPKKFRLDFNRPQKVHFTVCQSLKSFIYFRWAFKWWKHTKRVWKLFDCIPRIDTANYTFSITPLLEYLIIILICKPFSLVCRKWSQTSPYTCRTPVPCTLPPFPSGLHLWLFDWHNRTVARLSGILWGLLKVMLGLITWPENTLDALASQFKHK